jgi:ABC-type microcin C transport system permease subunit YejB
LPQSQRLLMMGSVSRRVGWACVPSDCNWHSFLVAGTLVVETVFAVPGMGQLLFTAITGRDYPVVQAVTVVSAVLVIVVNLVVDLS